MKNSSSFCKHVPTGVGVHSIPARAVYRFVGRRGVYELPKAAVVKGIEAGTLRRELEALL